VLTAFNGTYYTKMFRDNLRLAILRKLPQLPLQGVILFQENANLIPNVTPRHFLQERDWKILAHTSYSPDHALYD